MSKTWEELAELRDELLDHAIALTRDADRMSRDTKWYDDVAVNTTCILAQTHAQVVQAINATLCEQFRGSR